MNKMKGFTFIEFMIVTAIIGIISAIVLPLMDDSPDLKKYYHTSDGLVYTRGYHCELGVLLNYDRENVYSLEGSPIACYGEVNLTEEQVYSFLQKDELPSEMKGKENSMKRIDK